MKILITGATGLIGQALSLALFKAGHQLVIIVRNKIKAQKQLPIPCEFYAYLPHLQIPEQALANIDAVIHLAGEPIAQGRLNKAHQQQVYNSRVVGTQNLIKSLHQHRDKHRVSIFIGASAIGYYGDTQNQTIDENGPCGTDFLSTLCHDWEQASEPLQEQGIRRVIIRIGIVLDLDGGALPPMITALRTGFGAILGTGNQWMSPVHIDDVVRIFMSALTQNQWQGAYNAVMPESISHADFLRLLANTIHRPLWLKIPPIAIQALLGNTAALVLCSQRITPRRLTEAGFLFKYNCASQALSKLLFHGITQGLKQIQWFNTPIQNVFEFFSEAKNLELITPSFLNFHIQSQSTSQIQTGTEIDYTLKIHGIHTHWKTHISHYNPPFVFIDEQKQGPYRFWHHTHTFSEVPHQNEKGETQMGTLMVDDLRYQLPFGLLSEITASWFVKRDINQIFNYRRQAIQSYIK